LFHLFDINRVSKKLRPTASIDKVAVFEIRQSAAVAKLIVVLLPGVIRRLEFLPASRQGGRIAKKS